MPSGVSKGDIEKRLNVRIQHTIPDDQALALYTQPWVPYILGKGRSALTKAVRDLADHLVYDLMPATRGQAKAAGNAAAAEGGKQLFFGRFGNARRRSRHSKPRRSRRPKRPRSPRPCAACADDIRL